jgi:hypothetical protein
VWSAGDAKYLLVLALFIPEVGIIPFIGNIALLTIAYLLAYFIYFYAIKNTFNHTYRKSLWGNVLHDLKEKVQHFLKSPDGSIIKNIAVLKLLRWILIFLIIFVSMRLARIYIFKSIFKDGVSGGPFTFFEALVEKYNIYLIVACVVMLI